MERWLQRTRMAVQQVRLFMQYASAMEARLDREAIAQQLNLES